MAKITKKETSFRKEFIQQFVTLSTSGFGLVAALAWNEAIQAFVKDYIQKYYPDQSATLSKMIYAVIVTLLGVIITFQLSRLAARWGIKK